MGRTFVGLRTERLDTGRPPQPITRVDLVVDGEHLCTAGDDTGRTIEKTVPWASQAMAEAVLAQLRGIQYRPFAGEDALLDPAAEVGDGVTIGDVYSVLARTDIAFDAVCAADASAPGGDETEEEYPYKSRARREYEREIARTYSRITKTAQEIRLEVANEAAGLRSEFTVALDGITARVQGAEGSIGQLQLTAQNFQVQLSNANGAVSSIAQTVDSITLGVVNGQESSTITMYKNGIAVSSQNISFTGMVTFNDLSGASGTVIDGGAINTDTLRLNTLYGSEVNVIADSRTGSFNLYASQGSIRSHIFQISYWDQNIGPTVSIHSPNGAEIDLFGNITISGNVSFSGNVNFSGANVSGL